MSRGKNAEALRDFDRALEADPGRIEARRYRAIVLARQGEWERATREINGCLEREPRSAATLYAAACVVGRAFDKAGTTAISNQGLDLLERALAEGADPAKAAEDPDLGAIRRLPRFQRLISEARGSAGASSTGPR
jgi:tetratricopeptide (TPR) repeat protein